MSVLKTQNGARMGEHESFDVELYDAYADLVRLGKHYKFFNDRLDIDTQLWVEGLDQVLDRVYGKSKLEGRK